MQEYLIQSETLDDIADAINAKTGGSSAMTPAEMVTEIESIETGGGGADKYFEFVERKEYVHAENWTTDATGNGNNYLRTYMPRPDSGNLLYFIKFSNNSAPNYAITGGWCERSAINGADAVGVSIRNGNKYNASWTSSTLSLWCSAGATITVDIYNMKSLMGG